MFAIYNPATHHLTFSDDPNLAHMGSYVNASRIGTYLRPCVEQFFGALKRTFRVGSFYFFA
jgi:hypothetical protein